MIYHRISLSNAGPFLGDWDVELPDGPTVVVARYEESDVRSNRAGKSYFAVDAPLYALFGKFRGGSVDDFPHRLARGKLDAWVEVEASSSDGRLWRLRRGRTAGGDPIRELNGARVSDADLLRTVEAEVLGLSYDEYLNTNAFVQGRMHAFMEMTPAEKRRLVSPWFKTDRWIPRADLARRRLREAQAELRRLDAREEAARKSLEEREEREAAVEMWEGHLAGAREVAKEIVKQKAAAKAALDAAAEERARRARLLRDLERARKDAAAERRDADGAAQNTTLALERAKEAVREARGREERLRVLEGQEERLRALRDDLNAVREEIRAAKREVDVQSTLRGNLLERYKDLEKSRTGICPVLREECDRIQRDPAALDALKTEGLTARRALDRARRAVGELEWKADMALSDLRIEEESAAELRDLRNAVSLAEAERNYETAAARFQKAKADLARLKMKGSAATRAVRNLEREVAALPEAPGEEAERELAAAAELEAPAEQKLEWSENGLAGARAALAECERAEAEIAAIEGERAEVRERVRLLAWSSYAFGSAGIPSRELENAFGVAEDAMNRVLSDVGTSLRVAFAPTRELKEWEAACLACGEPFEKGERTHVCRACGTPRRKRRRDELRLEVEDGGNASAFELDSGGGKVLLSLGARLGLASLPGSLRAVRCEHLLIDEPDGALDEPNRAALHGLIQRRLSDLGVRQVLLITHADVRREFSSAVMVHRWEDEDRSAVWVD